MAFRGVEAEIEMAKYGLVGTRNLAAVPVTALLRANNISLWTGAITRAGGSVPYNSTPLTSEAQFLLEDGSGGYSVEDGTAILHGAGVFLLETSGSTTPISILGLKDWWPTPLVQRLIAFASDGTLLRDPSGTGAFELAKSGLSSGGISVFAEGGSETIGNTKKLFVTTGWDTVQVLDGDAVAFRDIGPNAPSDWTTTEPIAEPRSLFFHNGRLWAVLNHLLYGSTVTDHEDFTSTGAVIIPVSTGEGAYLQGGVSFKGRLFLWKWPAGIYWLDDASTTQANWLIKRLTPAVGLASPNTITLVDDDVLFLSEIGHIHMLSAVFNFGDVSNSDLTALNALTTYVKDRLDVSKTALERSWAIYYPEKKQARFAMRSVGSTFNDIQFIVDMNIKGTPRLYVEDQNACDALALRQDSGRVLRPVSGDSNGTVWLLDQINPNKNGLGYTSEFQVPHTDFAWYHEKLASVKKNYEYIEGVMQPTGNFSLAVDVIQDGLLKDSVLMNTGSGSAALGSFVLGTDVLAGEAVLNTRKRLRGSSRRVSFIGHQSQPDETFVLSQFIVGFTPGAS